MLSIYENFNNPNNNANKLEANINCVIGVATSRQIVFIIRKNIKDKNTNEEFITNIDRKFLEEADNFSVKIGNEELTNYDEITGPDEYNRFVVRINLKEDQIGDVTYTLKNYTYNHNDEDKPGKEIINKICKIYNNNPKPKYIKNNNEKDEVNLLLIIGSSVGVFVLLAVIIYYFMGKGKSSRGSKKVSNNRMNANRGGAKKAGRGRSK